MRRSETIPLALFRADASPKIGSGHVMRCLALADALSDEGWDCAFACNPEVDQVTNAITRSFHRTLFLSDLESNESQILKSHWGNGCDLLVVDHYNHGANFEASCRGWACKIAIIDDLANRMHDCDILFDQTLGRCPDSYAGLLPDNAICKTGSDYSILRPSFAAARPGALKRRSDTREVLKIMISVGASDQSHVIPIILDGVEHSGTHAHIQIVGNIDVPLNAYSFEPELISQTNNMAEFMTTADLAIGACGTSSWERCCLGLPTIALITAENQREIAKALSSSGAALLVDPISGQEIAAAVSALTSEIPVWKRMSRAAASVCDGSGTHRVVKSLKALFDAPEPARDSEE